MASGCRLVLVAVGLDQCKLTRRVVVTVDRGHVGVRCLAVLEECGTSGRLELLQWVSCILVWLLPSWRITHDNIGNGSKLAGSVLLRPDQAELGVGYRESVQAHPSRSCRRSTHRR
jgi:hypothetical protein